MPDIFTKEKRSIIMSKIRGKDTKPELTIRKLLFSHGYRYRLHVGDLPGSPDIVFTKKKKVIFINGCFWHGHNCKRATLPSTNKEVWELKIKKNVTRDINNYAALIKLGWRYLVVWQCEIKKSNIELLEGRLISFLEEE